MNEGHRDYATLIKLREKIFSRAGGKTTLVESLPELVRKAIDYVIDPVRTARTSIAELDKVEKTFVGLKIEHFLRDFLDVPKGVRDLIIDGVDVDVKNTVGKTWMIPKETYDTEGPCLLVCIADATGRCWLGLLVARDAYLNRPNRDGKRSVSKTGRDSILWLADGLPIPAGYWEGLDMNRFRQLRTLRPGKLRAATFFEENLRRPVHRVVVQSLLWDQHDYMKRLRSNGGARDLLAPKGIELLSGQYDTLRIHELDLPRISPEEMMSVRTS